MDENTITKYLGRKVFLILKNGFMYKVFLGENSFNNNVLSFLDKDNNPVDIDISTIDFITISNDRRENE
jgi:hypothetical protein